MRKCWDNKANLCPDFSGPLLPGYKGFPLERCYFYSIEKAFGANCISWTPLQTLSVFRKAAYQMTDLLVDQALRCFLD